MIVVNSLTIPALILGQNERPEHSQPYSCPHGKVSNYELIFHPCKMPFVTVSSIGERLILTRIQESI